MKSRKSYDKVLTLGHLNRYINSAGLKRLSEKYSIPALEEYQNDTFADRLLQSIFKAKHISSLDYSEYQGAEIIHDLNTHIPDKWHGQYDVIVDGGTLEHIFNVPVAIENYMKLTRINGSIFIFTMANNHLGHGFYQFSPEFFYRIFSEENGFKTESIVLDEHNYPGAEISNKSNCFETSDPAELKQRVGLINKKPVMIMVHAKKIQEKSLFQKFPIQSDYLVKYASDKEKIKIHNQTLVAKLMKLLRRIPYLHNKTKLRGFQQLERYSFRNKLYYKKVKY